MCDRNARTRNTFKPKKTVQEGSKASQLKRYASAVLGSGNLKQAVLLPEGEDLNEWLAVNSPPHLPPPPLYTDADVGCIAVDFFNQVNMLYSTVTEFCSPTACPTMSAGQRYEYLWADPLPSTSTSPGKSTAPHSKTSSVAGGGRGEPLKMSAPEYVDTLMTYIQSRIDDETTFPSKIGVPFPRGFQGVVKTIWRRLFRVYAHVYCEHFSVIVGLGLESHLNTSFKHFVLFAKEFQYPLPQNRVG
jgi:MOB kinase activator 1